ncbi:MAG: branched-chain amino acid ABC transporter permease [Pseudolysinimonas sp.]|uniref:branched-chain amino acid ABC transporter permease n=1 Tax=Pseudolysinimonas sp. TaxID=2680009 RepID=UPI003263371F
MRIAFTVVVAVVLAVIPLVSSKSINGQLSTMAVYAVAILGLSIMMGYAGQVSLGQSAFLGFGAYIAAYGVNQNWPVPVIFLACLAIPALAGLLVALAAARLRGLALAMVTIALPIIGIPLAKRFSDFTGGSVGTTVSWMKVPDWAAGFLANDQWRYYVVFVIAGLLFVIGRNLVKGRIGRAFAILKENEAVAIAMGVSPYRYKVLAFTIASMFGGAAGFLYLVVYQYTSPETLSFHVSINMVASMVIGGSGSILGALLGGVYYQLVPVIAGQIDPSSTALISGAILLLVLFLVPGGIVSLPRRILQVSRHARRRIGRSATTQNPPDRALAPAATSPESTEKSERKRQGHDELP